MKSSDHKFEPNKMLLVKMGWKSNDYYNFSKKHGSNVIFYITMGDFDYCLELHGDNWMITETNKNEVTIKSVIKTNIDLMKTLIDLEAYTLDYKREIRLNKLLK